LEWLHNIDSARFLTLLSSRDQSGHYSDSIEADEIEMAAKASTSLPDALISPQRPEVKGKLRLLVRISPPYWYTYFITVFVPCSRSVYTEDEKNSIGMVISRTHQPCRIRI
jgi:hypothetical protein